MNIMTEIEQALIERWLRQNEVKIVGDVRPIEECFISYERLGGK